MIADIVFILLWFTGLIKMKYSISFKLYFRREA